MKKRLLSAITSLCMLLTMTPQVFAAESPADASAAPEATGSPAAAPAALDLSTGSIEISAEGYKVGDGELVEHTGKYVLTGTTTTNTVTVTGGEQEITLSGVNIDVSGMQTGIPCAFAIEGGQVTLTLADSSENTLKSGLIDDTAAATGISCAGLWVNQGAELIINGGTDGSGKLTAVGGGTRSHDFNNKGKASGIGAGRTYGSAYDNKYNTVGDITINGGHVEATGSAAINYGGAGIGGGDNASSITINGGTVVASSGVTNHTGAAGIGSVYGHKENKTITITGGTVKAIGGSAGIGGGAYKNAGTIVINGGTVTATSMGNGAGIGGGGGQYADKYMGADGSITITGGTVTAQGGQYGAGIGGGGANVQAGDKSGAQASGNITITGGAVKATGGQYAPGIGSGALGAIAKVNSKGEPVILGENAGKMGEIVISGGSVNAVNGEDFLAPSSTTERAANSYKTLDDSGEATVDSGIGQGRNASATSWAAFEDWTPKNGNGEDLIIRKEFSANSVTYTRNGDGPVKVSGADGKTVLYLPEGYYTFDGERELVAAKADKATADELIGKLNAINSDRPDAQAVTEAEADYTALTPSLRYYVDATVKAGHKLSELKEQLKNANIKVNVDFRPGTTEQVEIPVQKQVTFGAKNVELIVPTRKNYTFTGWWMGDRQMTGADGIVAEWDILSDTTLTAHWVSEVTGKGTESDPYLIYSADNLIALSHISLGIGTDADYEVFGLTNTPTDYNTLMHASYKLEQNITLRTADKFYGIGGLIYNTKTQKASWNYFYGTFDGGNKTITLDIDTTPYISNEGTGDDDYTINGHMPLTYDAEGKAVVTHTEIIGGIFNYAQACTIRNVHTTGRVVLATKKNSAGVIAGTVSTAKKAVLIENCVNDASITVGATFNVSTAGGIIGANNSTNPITIRNCVNNGNVFAGAKLTIKDGTTACQGNSLAAGICAQTSAASAVFIDCTNNGNITGTRQTDFAGRNTRVAGIAAILSNEAEFKNCTNTGDIKADSFSADAAAGIAVSIGKTKAFTNCTNSGAVYATTGTAGAIFGDLDTAGSLRNAVLTNCWQTVQVTEKNDGWKLSTDEAVKVENTDAGYVLRLPIADETSNYFSEDRYIVNASGEKAADLYSGDGSTLYKDLTHNSNPTASEYPFQSESTAYTVSNAQQYINLVKAIRGDAAAQNAVLGNRLSGATVSAKAAVLATAHVKVTGDFTLSDVDAIGLGTDTLPFSGVVYGQDHTITYAVNETAMAKTAGEMIGFVGNAMGATVRDLNFDGNISVMTKADNDKRLFIGAAVAAGSSATVENCSSTADITVVHNGAVNNATMGMTYIGGLIGRQSASGVVKGARYEGDITVTAPKNACAGGIAGLFAGSMEDVQALGDITANEKANENIAKYGENSYAGGIAGIMDGALKDATAAGFIKATNDCTFANVYAYAGGLVGNTTSTLTVDTCKALTTVTATYDVKSGNAREGVILGTGTLSLSGSNWYLKTDDTTVADATALDPSVLTGHTFGDTIKMAAPEGVTMDSEVASFNDDTVSFTKAADAGAVNLVYDGYVFYSTTVAVAAKKLTSDGITITGINSAYTNDAAAADAAVTVIYNGEELVKGTDYTITQDQNAHKFTVTFRGNYTGSIDQTYNVDANALTVSSKGYNSVYDGKMHSIAVDAPEGSTVKYSEALSAAYSMDTVEKKDAGTYIVYWQASKDAQTVTGSDAIVIDKAALTITADDKSMTVGGTMPEFTYTVSGLVKGDKLTAPKLTCSADGSTEGIYDIIAAGAAAGNNYTIAYVNGTLTVSRRSSSSSSSGSSSTGASNTVSVPSVASGKVTVTPSTAKKGDTVTVTVTPDAGYQLDKLTVTDAKGKTIAVTKKSDSKYTFTMPDSKVTITPTFNKIEDTKPSKNGFADVASSAWYADAVKYVTEKGLMNGTGDNQFSPNASTTRGMLMTVLARYAGEDTTGGATWYEKGMNWAKANGVSDGTNPTANITREQLVTMLYRYAGSPAASGSLDNFSDAASVSSYAVNAMQWAVANGIVNGSNGKLNPQNNATRAEVAAILMRFCEMSK